MDSSGKWPDVDYTTGCDARRANWPAQIHWTRLRASFLVPLSFPPVGNN